MRIASTLALAVLVAAGCSKSTGPTLSLGLAEATPSCAPNDGPAVAIRFAPSPTDTSALPVVQVSVFRSRAELAAKRWTLPSEQAQAWIQRTSAPEFDPATEGLIRIDAVEADGTISGSIDLRFADGTRFDRNFRAPWRERAMLCG